MFMDHTAAAVSVLALELTDGDVAGFRRFLAERGIQIVADGLGRAAISHNDARMLIAERAAAEVEADRKRREVTARQEAAAIEQANKIWKGLSADQVPVGITATEAMMAADYANRPRRRNPVEDALDGRGTVFHPYQEAS